MNWRTKWRVQKLLAQMPLGDNLYYLLQSRFGGLRDYKIDMHLCGAMHLISSLESAGVELKGSRAVEIGTGWVPVIPLALFLYGVDHCDTYDISKLLKENITFSAARQLVADSMLQLQCKERVQTLDEATRKAPTASDLLRACGITYHAPADASTTVLPDAGVDFIYSYNVLEHVEESQIPYLLNEARRILRPNGVIAHVIDLSDHFSHADSSITSIHFIQYSPSDYAQYNTKFQYQNRLRASHWRDLFVSSGFDPIVWQTAVDEKSLNKYSSLKIDEHYQNLTPEENCITSLTVVARKTTHSGK